jgi:LPXTG-motif cell wall-anchored protein
MRKRKKQLGYATSDERTTNALLIVGGLLAIGIAGVVMSKKPA